MSRTIDFTRGKIMGPLLKFAGPVLFAMFLQALYGAVDLLVVGRFATNADVSGVAVGAQLMTTMTNVVINLAMGVTILLSQKTGAGKIEEGGRIIGCSIVLFAGIGIALSVVMPFAARGLTVLMNVPEESFRETQSYVMICGGGSLMIAAYNILGAIFRGIGDATTPLMTVAVAAVINIFGDVLLVNGFGLGSSGAAIATVASQTISVLVSVVIISRQKLPFAFHVHDIRPDKTYMSAILRYGIPIALQEFLVSISFLVILAIVNSLGVIASAGVGVAEKVCAFIMLVPSSFMQSMTSFVAQNKGAGKMDRALTGLRLAMIFSTVLGILMFYLAFFHGRMLCGIFSSDGKVLADAVEYLKAYAIDCLLTCIVFCMIGFYNGLGRTRFVMAQGILAAFLVRIPVSFLMSRTVGTLFSIGLAVPCSSLFQITISMIYLFRLRKRFEAD